MMKFFLFLLLFSISFAMSAQVAILRFTGRDTTDHFVKLDHLIVKNLTRDWQETLQYPDTTLTISFHPSSVEDLDAWQPSSLQWTNNYPNPFQGSSMASLAVGDEGDVMVDITDITGRTVSSSHEGLLQPGVYQWNISLASTGVYFLTARQNGRTASVKLVNQGNGGKNEIQYRGNEEKPTMDIYEVSNPKGHTPGPFNAGDSMEYEAFAMINGEEMVRVTTVEQWSCFTTIKLYFAFQPGFNDGYPCPRFPTVTDHEGNVYNTVQIGNQCWMKENLRTTSYPDGTLIPIGTDLDQSTPYRYAPNYDTSNVATYGYVYNFPAIIYGSPFTSDLNPSGVRGICPVGWHLPSDAEWEQLKSYVGGLYGCVTKSLAAPILWQSAGTNNCYPGNDPTHNNVTGFTALPAGECLYSTLYYYGLGQKAGFWSCTETCNNHVLTRDLNYNNSNMSVAIDSGKDYAFSVRCVRD